MGGQVRTSVLDQWQPMNWLRILIEATEVKRTKSGKALLATRWSMRLPSTFVYREVCTAACVLELT
jgi:hypothetical protein